MTVNYVGLPIGFVSIDDLFESYPGISGDEWEALAQGVNIPISRVCVTNSDGVATFEVNGFFWDDLESIEAGYRTPIAGDDVISCKRLSLELKVAQKTLLEVAAENEVPVSTYLFYGYRKSIGFNQEQSDALREIFARARSKIAGEDFITANKLASELKISRETLIDAAKSKKIPLTEYFFDGRFSCIGFDSEQSNAIRKEIARMKGRIAKENIISISQLARELKVKQATILSEATQQGIPRVKYVFGNRLESVGFNPEQSDSLRKTINGKKVPTADENIHSFNSVVRQRKTSGPKLKATLKELGIEMKYYLFNGTKAFGLTADQIGALDVYEKAQKITPATANVASVKKAARSRNMTEKKLLELAEGVQINTKPFLIKGKPVECFTDEQLLAIEQAYAPEIMEQLLPISIRRFALDNGMKPQDILDLAQAAGVELKTYFFGSKQNIGITPDEIKAIETAFGLSDSVQDELCRAF